MTTRTTFAPPRGPTASPLARMTPRPAASAEEMRAMAAGAWARGWLCVALDDAQLGDWERASAVAIGTRLFGERRK